MIIGNDHGDGPEKDFDVVGQFGPSHVPRVERGENAWVLAHIEKFSVKLELVPLFKLGVSDDVDLGGNHREHFDFDTVELVEATPAASGDLTHQQFFNRFCVIAIRAIEHDTLSPANFGQILAALSFASSCRTRRIGSQFALEGRGNGEETTVGERCDDKTSKSPHWIR